MLLRMVYKLTTFAEIVIYAQELAQIFLVYSIWIHVFEKIGVEPFGKIANAHRIDGIHHDIRI